MRVLVIVILLFKVVLLASLACNADKKDEKRQWMDETAMGAPRLRD